MWMMEDNSLLDYQRNMHTYSIDQLMLLPEIGPNL